MQRRLEALGISVEQGSGGLAIRIHTPTERALIVVEGSCEGEHSTLHQAGMLVLEHRANVAVSGATSAAASAGTQQTIDLRAEHVDRALGLSFELLSLELKRDSADPRVLHGLCEVLLAVADRAANRWCPSGVYSSHVYSSDLCPSGTAVLRPQADAVRDLCVRKALTLLASRLTERWTVSRLARELGLSRAALARRFLRALGTSPLRYLTSERIRVAERLLLASDAALSEIARQVGYESEFAFSRAFKRLRGVAPGQFRRALGTAELPVMALAA